MRSTHMHQKRIITIDPVTRGFGFAVLEGPEDLIDWGVKEARNRDKKTRSFIRSVIYYATNR